MTFVYFNEKPPLSDLVQSGVKGMRWGVRKANPSTLDIAVARNNQERRSLDLNTLNNQLKTARTSAERKRIEKQLHAKAVDFQTNEDRVTAARLTRGEKAVALILTGPIGLVTIGAHSVEAKRVRKEVDKMRAGIKSGAYK